jgi:hypothetical protein
MNMTPTAVPPLFEKLIKFKNLLPPKYVEIGEQTTRLSVEVDAISAVLQHH